MSDALDFVLVARGGHQILDWSAKGGKGCRPATDPEIAMWAEIERLTRALSDSVGRWLATDALHLPDDEQRVVGYWSAQPDGPPSYEILTYYAEDAPDGPARWRDQDGEVLDEPDYWMPLEPPK